MAQPTTLTPGARGRRRTPRPLGLEVRFRWGSRLVGECFLRPGAEQAVTIGAARGVTFAMGEGHFGGATFTLARLGTEGATLRFTSAMTGQLDRGHGQPPLSLAETRRAGLATSDGDAHALSLGEGDAAWLDVGGNITVEAGLRPAPLRVVGRLADAVDFTLLNALLLLGFAGALFAIGAVNRDTEGQAEGEPLADAKARLAKVLPRAPPPTPSSASTGASPARSHARAQPTAARSVRQPTGAARAGAPTAKQLVAQLFGAHVSGVVAGFGPGLGGALDAALGGVVGVRPGDSAGLGGLSLRGAASSGPGESEVIGGLGTKGRAGGLRDYGEGSGVLGDKQRPDITPDGPTVLTGGLDRDLVRQVIHLNRGQLRYCYERQLTRHPTLDGRVEVRFVISAAGTVASSTVVQSTVGDPELEACAASRVKTWQFPKPKGGGTVVVSYPFVFKQSGR